MNELKFGDPSVTLSKESLAEVHRHLVDREKSLSEELKEKRAPISARYRQLKRELDHAMKEELSALKPLSEEVDRVKTLLSQTRVWLKNYDRYLDTRAYHVALKDPDLLLSVDEFKGGRLDELCDILVAKVRGATNLIVYNGLRAPIFKAWLDRNDLKGLKVVEDHQGVQLVFEILFSDGKTRTLICDMALTSCDREYLNYAYFGERATVTVVKYTQVNP